MRMFGKRCSAVDVLGIALIAHPHDPRTYAALQHAISRTTQPLYLPKNPVSALLRSASTASFVPVDEEEKAANESTVERQGDVLLWGDYSYKTVLDSGVGCITFEVSPDEYNETGKSETAASWVLNSIQCTTTLDVVALEYYRNCHRREDILGYLQKMRSVILDRCHDTGSDPLAAMIRLRQHMFRHPKQERNSLLNTVSTVSPKTPNHRRRPR